MNFTEEQLMAIEETGKNIIVSAGAGSGKTAVLTERVKQKLLNGIHINELLVLTFTNAAAKEMKERIRKAISKIPSLKPELDLIDGAYITTFDSFSLSMVKKYHTVLNITNKIEITEEGIINLKKNEILDTIFEKKYLSPTKRFLSLINDFCLKDDNELKKSILDIYQKLELKTNKDEYLRNYIDSYYNEENINKCILEYIDILKEKQRELNESIKDLDDYFDTDFISKIEANFKKLLEANNYNDFLQGIEYKIIQVPRNTIEIGKIKKQKVYDIAKKIKELLIYKSTEEIKEEILSTKNNTEEIISIIIELDKRLTNYKLENNIYNFNDIASLSIKVIEENEDIKEELKNSFKEICIDEYQDTSDIQEKFISLIENNNVYMVGDVKQSIYRFRNANPYIFKSKYDSYSKNENGIKIDLLKNFRSRREVLENINEIFNQIMSNKIGGANYKETHQMVFGNISYEKEGKTTQNNYLELLTYDKKNLGNISESEQEAFIIGMDIKNKIKNKYLIYDKDLKELRPIEYKDFVILLDKSKYFDLYKKIFEYLQIPLSILKEESLMKEDDILVLKSIIELLICIKENLFEEKFKYAYTSISRSFLYKLSDEEIYNIFINDSYKTTELYKIGEALVKDMDIIPLSELYLKILDVFHYEEKLITIGNIKEYRIREEYLYNLCKNYEKNGNTIEDFLDYLNQIFDSTNDLKFNMNITSSNSVKIMTIHKSKGLEFPICYFASFQSRFNIQELKEKILYDNKYGIILPKVDEYYKDTIIKTLCKKNYKREEISEKIRLFYVALTRAKEKMIMVIPEEEVIEEELTESIKESYNSFLSIVRSIYQTFLPYKKDINIRVTKDYLNNTKERNLKVEKEHTLEVKEINIENEEIEKTHYSKSSLHIPTKEEVEVMDFGTKVHEILELIDFNSYDLSNYKINKYVKEKINSFINSNFMKDKLNNKMYKEYEFIYEEDNKISHGIIDLLIEKDNEMIIVDYKLKNIEDREYDKQLNGYKKVIEKLTNKKTSCYLYSIINEQVREICYD